MAVLDSIQRSIKETCLQSSVICTCYFCLVPVNLTKVSPYNQTVREGSNETLLCEATGRPKPNIIWTRVLENGGNGEVLHQGKTWNFPNINRTVSGKYRCTADNGYGNPVSHKVEVNVLCEYIISPLCT